MFEHQERVLNLSKDKAAFGWFLETGTGKTILACENIRYLHEQKKIKAVLITAPKTVLKPVWVKTLRENYRDLRFYLFQWIGDFTQAEEQIFNHMISAPKQITRLPILLADIEAFSHARVFVFVKQLCVTFPTLWIIDESTTIKSPKANRTKQILSISHLAQYKRILSGFPVLRTPEDLYTQVSFLSPQLTGHKSFYSFRNEYCITRKLDNRIVISTGARNTSKLQSTLETFSSRIMKKDCLDLPDKVRTRRFVDLAPEQAKLYKQMAKEGYIQLKESKKEVFAQTILVQLSKLHLIANGILSVDPIEYSDSNKYKILLNIIEHEIGDKQVIIWAFHIASILAISKLLLSNKIGCNIIFSGTSMTDRNKAIESFTEGKIQCIAANPGAVMHGINWQNSHYAIYFSNSFNLEHRIQSEDRQHRIGQVNKVTYIDLITENTIESKILDTLENKHSVGAASLGDEWKEWFN